LLLSRIYTNVNALPFATTKLTLNDTSITNNRKYRHHCQSTTKYKTNILSPTGQNVGVTQISARSGRNLFTPLSIPWRRSWSKLLATENIETVLSSLEMRSEQSFILSRPSFQFVTRTCLQTRSHRRQDWTKLFSLQYIEDPPSNHVFKVGGSSSLVYGITTFLQKEIRQATQFGAVGYIITLCTSKGYVKSGGSSKFWGVRKPPSRPPVVAPLFIKKAIKSWGIRPNFMEVRTPRPPLVVPLLRITENSLDLSPILFTPRTRQDSLVGGVNWASYRVVQK